MFSLFQGAKVEQKLVLKKYVFVNLFIKFLKVKRGVIFRLSFAVSISEVGKVGRNFFLQNGQIC